ncbi:MAG: hypothetical protein H6543_03110 [Prevotellaceae bacterium]|nr:hypothetical protein [Prevotellaceae bacterium]
MSNNIEKYCKSQDVSVIAKLPFDRVVVDAMVNCKSVIEYAPDSEIAALLTEAYLKLHDK